MVRDRRWRATEPRPTRRIAAADLAFAAGCLGVGLVRFTVLAHPGSPPGIDGGNWLALAAGLRGHPVRSSSIVYPPAVPLLVDGAVRTLGVTAGIAVVAAVSSLAPAVACFVALRRHTGAAEGAALAGLLAATVSTGEAAAWGGYPQLLGLGAAVGFLVALDRALDTGRLPAAALAAAGLALLLGTSHLVAMVGVPAAVLVTGARLGARRGAAGGDGAEPSLRRTALVAAVAATGALPWLPLYARIAAASGDNPDRARFLRVNWATIGSDLHFVIRDVPAIWSVLLAIAVGTPMVGLARRRHPLWLVSSAWTTVTTVLLVLTREPRLLYMLPVGAVLATGLLVATLEPDDRWRAAARAALALAVVAVSATGLGRFPSQRRSYAIVTPGVLDAIDWLRLHTPTDAVVAVSPVDDAPLGWWVEGLGARRSLPGSALRWLNFQDERRRAAQANAIFRAGFVRRFPDQASLDVAAASGAGAILVAKRWSGYDAAVTAEFALAHPGLVAYENDGAVILRVR